MIEKTYVLMILDGYGLGEAYGGNAIALANKPNLNRLLETYPHTRLEASGPAVGLPVGQMGNSEVGHLNIGAGRIMYQDLTKITHAIETGEFFEKREFLDAIAHVKENDSAIHLMGLLSDGGVHSYNGHLYALLELMKRHQVDKVYVHVITDGRDVPPQSALEYLDELDGVMDELGVGEVATVSGRYYAMDRDNRWERVKLAYDAMVSGLGPQGTSAKQVVKDSYASGINDEFIIPTPIQGDQGGPVATINDRDAVIFFNFRPDRARQLTRALTDENFQGFERDKVVRTHYVTMTEYDKTIPNTTIAYRDESPKNTLGEYLSARGKTQLRLAETEKYPHVTFFFNGGREESYPNEDRILIASPKVATYDMEPEMSAGQITDSLVEALESFKYDVIIVNYANCDMVGHTGSIPATVKAVETVDKSIGRVMDVVKRHGHVMLITADHGNAECMLDEDGGIVTAHTTNPVPLILVGGQEGVTLSEGKLADLAPTVLELMGLDQPEEMTGESLIRRNNR